jgi:hypothetical protein
MTRCLAAILVLLGALGGRSAVAADAPVEVRARLEARPVTIGTPFRYTLEISAAPGSEVSIPQLAGAIGDLQIVDFGSAPDRQVDGRTVSERWYSLVTYATGEHPLPGPTVQYRGGDGELHDVAAPDLSVSVQSVFEAAGPTPSDVRDIRGPVEVPRDYTALWWIAGAVLAVLALVALLVRRLRRPVAVPAAPPRPAHELAMAALARLRAAGLIEAERYEEYYVLLSAIVRVYVEARFRLRAPEMTTEEFLQVAQRGAQLTPPQRGLLGQFLGEADLVKFARHHPSPADAERAYDAAQELVRSTAAEEPRAAA